MENKVWTLQEIEKAVPREGEVFGCQVCENTEVEQHVAFNHYLKHERDSWKDENGFYVCPHCPNVRYKDFSRLYTHFMGMHTELRPYVCTKGCSRAFCWKSSLGQHKCHQANQTASAVKPDESGVEHERLEAKQLARIDELERRVERLYRIETEQLERIEILERTFKILETRFEMLERSVEVLERRETELRERIERLERLDHSDEPMSDAEKQVDDPMIAASGGTSPLAPSPMHILELLSRKSDIAEAG